MTTKVFIKNSKIKVATHHNKCYNNIEDMITEDDVVLVWFCKTIQNYKAILYDGERFYESTYNGDKRETYLDVYEKIDKIVY